MRTLAALLGSRCSPVRVALLLGSDRRHFKLLSRRGRSILARRPGDVVALKERLESARDPRVRQRASCTCPTMRAIRLRRSRSGVRRVQRVGRAEFSVEPKAESSPITGCVATAASFGEGALRHAGRLRAEGYDVYVGGILAYSTLGWFDDRCSTFIRYPRVAGGRLVFHDCAPVVHAKNDTTFTSPSPWWWGGRVAAGWTAKVAPPSSAAFQAARRESAELAARIMETRERLKAHLTDAALAEAMLEQKKGVRPACTPPSRHRAGGAE